MNCRTFSQNPRTRGKRCHHQVRIERLAARSTLPAIVLVQLDINQPSLPTPFYSRLVFMSVFVTLSTVFYPINSPDNSPFSHSVLPVLPLAYWFFQLYISLWKCLSALI